MPCALRSRVAPASATSRATAAPAFASRSGRCGTVPPSSPKRSMTVRTRRTARSTCCSRTPPSRTAEASAVPKWVPSGISMSRPAMRALRVLCAADQSVITQPVNPQRSRRTPVSSSSFSQAKVPLTLLYAPITAPVPAATAASKPRSSVSCRVRSSTRTSTEVRSRSWLLSAKCLTVAMSPSPWMPSISAATRWAESSGSSLKVSKLRPAYGVRMRLTIGDSSTSWPRARPSRPMTWP